MDERRKVSRAERRRLAMASENVPATNIDAQTYPVDLQKEASFKLSFGDLLALIAFPLTVAAMFIDNMIAVVSCLCLSVAIPCFITFRH
jgi:hypothetical protein